MKFTMKKVAFATTTVLLVIIAVFLGFGFNRKIDTSSTSNTSAARILSDAGIRFSRGYKKEPIITKLKKNSFEICYTDTTAYSKKHNIVINVKEIASVEEFLKHYEQNYFTSGYGQGINWHYTQKGNTLTPYLAVSSKIIVENEENYEIMFQRPHVETTGKLVEEIIKQIPFFEITEGNYFFTIDEKTRMIGWFYFKSNYNGKNFIGCYSVEGWDSSITYENLINLNNLSIKHIGNGEIYLSTNPK